MSWTNLSSLELDLGKRDDRRRMARHLGLSPSFCEQLTGVTYDADGEAMVVHSEFNGNATGSLAICSNPLGRRAPVFEGTPGVWHSPTMYVHGAPAVIGFDIKSVEGGSFAMAPCSLVCMSPQDLMSADEAVLTRAFLDSGVAEEIAWQHGASSSLVILSAKHSQVPDCAFNKLAWALAKSGYYAPIIRAPRLDLKDFARPEHPRRHRLAKLIQVVNALMLRQTEAKAGFLPGESFHPRDGRAAA